VSNIISIEFDRNKTNGFWNLFSEYSSLLLKLADPNHPLFTVMNKELSQIDGNVSFSLGEVREEDHRALIISANGVIDSFPAVERLISLAPKDPCWTFYKFMPRRLPLGDLTYDNKYLIPAKDVYYKLFKQTDSIYSIQVFLPGLRIEDTNAFNNMAMLILNASLGEFDLAVKIKHIKVECHGSNDFVGAHPIKNLPVHIDEIFSKNKLM